MKRRMDLFFVPKAWFRKKKPVNGFILIMYRVKYRCVQGLLPLQANCVSSVQGSIKMLWPSCLHKRYA